MWIFMMILSVIYTIITFTYFGNENSGLMVATALFIGIFAFVFSLKAYLKERADMPKDE